MEENKLTSVEQTCQPSISIISLKTYFPNAGKFVACKTAEESFTLQLAEKVPSLFTLAKQPGNDEKKVIALIKMHVIDCVRFFKVAKPLTENEIDRIAEEIYSGYCYYFTFTDVSLVLKRAVTETDTLYNKLEVRDVIKWFKEYNKEKTEFIETYRANESKVIAKGGDAKTKEEIDKETQNILRTYQKHKEGKEEKKPSTDAQRALNIKQYAENNGEDYKKWRDEQLRQQILNKPENERTENERRFLSTTNR